MKLHSIHSPEKLKLSFSKKHFRIFALGGIMHTKHLGVDVHFLGSVLALLVDFILPGTVQQNLDTIAVFMRGWYKKVCNCKK